MIQVYNSRSKKWVLMDETKKGGIVKMQAEPFDGVPMKDKEPEPTPEPETPQFTPEPDYPLQQSEELLKREPNETGEDEDNSKDESGGGWASVFGL